jgi:hypothetical protein
MLIVESDKLELRIHKQAIDFFFYIFFFVYHDDNVDRNLKGRAWMHLYF